MLGLHGRGGIGYGVEISGDSVAGAALLNLVMTPSPLFSYDEHEECDGVVAIETIIGYNQV